MSIVEVTTRVDKWLERRTKRELVSIILANLDRVNLFADHRNVCREGHEAALSVNINGEGELVIRIGVNTLAQAFQRQEDNNPYDEKRGGFKRLYRVTDAVEFAKEVRVELCREEENGATPLTDLLDKVCMTAVDNGAFGVEEDGRIDPQDEE